MARFINPEVVALRDSLEPAIGINVTASVNRLETLLGVNGELLSADGKIIGPAHESREQTVTTEVYASRWWENQRDQEERQQQVRLNAHLSRRTIDYIETLRANDRKGDVHLRAKLFYTILRSSTNIRPTTGLPMAQVPNYEIMATPADVRSWSSNRLTDWVLSAQIGGAFARVESLAQSVSLLIPSSDWIHDFAPALGLGEFIVVELPQLAPVENGGQLAERINAAVASVKEMKAKLLEGEYDEVIEKARPVVELIKHSELRPFLSQKLDYPVDAEEALWSTLTSLIQFTSKYHHATTKERTVRPPIPTNKEDAYFVLSVCVGLVNLIGRKSAKAV